MDQEAVKPMGRAVQRPPEVEKNGSHSPPVFEFYQYRCCVRYKSQDKMAHVANKVASPATDVLRGCADGCRSQKARVANKS